MSSELGFQGLTLGAWAATLAGMTENRKQIKITIYEDEVSALYGALSKIANFSGVLKMTEDEHNVTKTLEARLRKLRALQIANQLMEKGQA